MPLDYETLARVALPIFVMDSNDRPLDFCGTGFVMARNLFVTCWHCVERLLPSDHRYVAITLDAHEKCCPVPLIDLKQDANGTDLATATIDMQALLQLRLGGEAYILSGHDVWTFGYPFTDRELQSTGELNFTLQGRILRGYVTRTMLHARPLYGEVSSYEIDLPVPAGLSGAPLILRGGGYAVVGVIYGTKDEVTITEFSAVDPKTGARTPEIQRILSFGLAHTTPALRRLRGPATHDLPLEEYILRVLRSDV